MKDMLVSKMYADKVIEELNKEGLLTIIAGGYPRDLYFNKQPRDLDIFVYKNTHEYPNYKLITIIETVLNKVFDKTVILNQNYKNMNFANFKCEHDIDVIINFEFYNPFNVRASEYVVSDFDSNINQFILEEGKPGFVGKNMGKLEFYKSIEPARINKIIKYAKEVGWL